ncbi:hypothetical protein IAR55_005578 [Kwoniella newhampshirensis]|uniref:Choline transporter n=1 Tax=Kwoniella newhampshirensis TaxID=1651941 RepID=A0AAW0YMM4_9TREE
MKHTTEKDVVPTAEVEVFDQDVRVHQTGEVELERNFRFLDALGMAFAMLNSWTAMAASLSLILPSGGPVAMTWGLCVSAVGSLAMCATLAEICHVYPSLGGQYDWAYLLAPPAYRRGLAWIAGWMTAAGWVSVTATGSSLGASFVIGLISIWNENYVTKPYHTFLVYLAFTVGAFLLNTFAVRALPMVDRIALFWSLTGIVTVIIVVLSTSKGDYETGRFVFTTFVNETGWPGGVAFLLGLLQSTFGLTGFDAISHMIEEMPNPRMNAPRIMVSAVLLGSVTSFLFIVCVLFSINDFDGLITTSYGALLDAYYQATSSRAGATGLIMFNLVAMAFATQGLMTVASRIVMSTARDGLYGPLSPHLARVHPRLAVPHWSLVFVAIWIIIFDLGSSVALNAILSSSVVLLEISYIIPIMLVLLRGTKVLEPEGYPKRILTMGKFRPFVNIFAAIFAIVTITFFCFPPAIPVSGTSMNYVVVVVAFVCLLCLSAWLVSGKKHYQGPKVKVAHFE